MPTVHFYGQVYPTTLLLTINDYTIDYEDPQLGKMKLFITIRDSTVTAKCTFDSLEFSEKGSALFFRILQLTQSLVDLSGFAIGAGLEVIFNAATIADNPTGPIEYRQQYLARLCSAISLRDTSFNDLFNVLREHPASLFALYDLKLALTHKIQQPTHCARAIESLRSYFGAGDKRKEGWERFRNNLNITQPYLQFITDQSQAPRHGSFIDISADDSRALLERTWIVANRFFEFRKRGDKALPLTEFPLL